MQVLVTENIKIKYIIANYGSLSMRICKLSFPVFCISRYILRHIFLLLESDIDLFKIIYIDVKKAAIMITITSNVIIVYFRV